MQKVKKKWSTVDILRHTRHDWLNNLQLIKGNLDLNKIERVKEIIAKIIIETQNEARLTNLNLAAFSGDLMTFKWERHHFQLEFEVLGEVKDLSKYDESLAEWTSLFFQILDQVVEKENENHLSVSIVLNEHVCFFFDFSGIIKKEDYLNKWLQKNDNSPYFQLIEKMVNQGEISFILKLN